MLLIGFGLIIGTILCEIGLRVAGISFPVFDTFDANLGKRLRPGKEGWYRKEGEAYLKINSLGFRDGEHTLAKPNGVFRIVVLGDSFTEARQVALKDTFWKQCEKLLEDDERLSGRQIETIGFGVGGYGTTEALLTYERYAAQFNPDLVILAFTTGNDIANNSVIISEQDNLMGARERPFYQLKSEKLQLDTSFNDFSLALLQRKFLMELIHYSRLLEVINQVRRTVNIRRIRENSKYGQGEIGLFDAIYNPPQDSAWQEAWQITELIIEKLNGLIQSQKANFAIITLSNPIQVNPDFEKRELFQDKLGVKDLFYPERRIQQIGTRLGIPVLNLAPHLQQFSQANKIFLHGFENTALGTGHWNEKGHQEAARLMANWLIETGQIRTKKNPTTGT